MYYTMNTFAIYVCSFEVVTSKIQMNWILRSYQASKITETNPFESDHVYYAKELRLILTP
jgi:hypothetical protein